MSTSPKRALLAVIDAADDSSTWQQLTDLVASLRLPAESKPASALIYSGWKRTLITMLAVATPVLALNSAYSIQYSRSTALLHYAAWCLGPPAWFFLEWVWLFDSQGDAARLTKFKTTTELAQKFWAAVVVLMGVEILVLYGTKL